MKSAITINAALLATLLFSAAEARPTHTPRNGASAMGWTAEYSRAYAAQKRQLHRLYPSLRAKPRHKLYLYPHLERTQARANSRLATPRNGASAMGWTRGTWRAYNHQTRYRNPSHPDYWKAHKRPAARAARANSSLAAPRNVVPRNGAMTTRGGRYGRVSTGRTGGVRSVNGWHHSSGSPGASHGNYSASNW